MFACPGSRAHATDSQCTSSVINYRLAVAGGMWRMLNFMNCRFRCYEPWRTFAPLRLVQQSLQVVATSRGAG